MGMLGLNLPPGQMCVRTAVTVCKECVCVDMKGKTGRGGGGGVIHVSAQ